MLFHTLVVVGILMFVNVNSFLLKNHLHTSPLNYYKTDTKLFAHKTGTSNTKNNRDSRPKYLGLKRSHNMFVYAGNIIARQRGAHFKPGIGAAMGRDFTIYAKRSGRLQVVRRRISVLDLVSEERYFKDSTKNYESPTITMFSRLWTKKSLK
ncbi:50S ribosomal protein L27 [Theileria orientalis]|uniref:50S ribosomal protein L27 n=1 Tax=Theileria orientalis TaxID=68886 RepID=A0A976SKM6_THEOR|nr:50S ribosomal protein L27 [Theileria orientalis]